MRQGSRFGAVLFATVLIGGLAACETPPPTLSDRPAPGEQGLYMLDNAGVNLAAARPDVDWSSYDSIMISDLIIPDAVLNAAPRNPARRASTRPGDNWRIPRSDGRRLTNEFRNQLTREFQNGGEFQVVQTPGPGTLVLRTQLTNIELVAPFNSTRPQSPRGIPLQTGSLSISGDLVDAQTGETLALFADNRMSSTDMWRVNNTVTNFADASRIFRQWGVLLRGSLLAAQAGTVPASSTSG